jgi:hypothetical protein
MLMLRTLLGTMAVALLLPAAAEANWFRSWYAPRTAYYYPPTVVYFVPAPPVVAVPCPVPLTPAVGVAITPAQPPLATPTPAPPSRTPEPPVAAPTPVPAPAPVAPPPETGERRYYDAYAASGRAGVGDRASVNLWNLSGQDLAVLIGGQRLFLPRGRSVNVSVARQFTWQIEGRAVLAEQVPAGEAGLEIVIRQ